MRHLDEVIWLFRTRPLDRYQCLFLAGGFSILLPVKLFPLGRHPPQDGDDKADGHLDVRRELAQVLAGIGMTCLAIGHGCSRLNRSSQSSRMRTMICRRFGEKQVETARGGERDDILCLSDLHLRMNDVLDAIHQKRFTPFLQSIRDLAEDTPFRTNHF